MDESDRNLVWNVGEESDQARKFPLKGRLETEASRVYRLFQQHDGQTV